jgi:hypothetical protein
MKERSLSEIERAAIAEHGLWNLNSFLPKKPDDDHLRAIMEMFTASVDGDPYDAEKWGQYYRPNGMRMDTVSSDSSQSSPVTARPSTSSSGNASSILNKLAARPVTVAEPVEDNTPPWEDRAVSESSDDKPKMQTPDDIIAAIRRRQQQK